MKLTRTLLGLCAVAVALPVQAAEPPSIGQIRKFLADYGQCVAKREPELARKAVVSGANFKRESPEGKRLMQRECMDEDILANATSGFQGRLRMRMDDDTYRGVIAEALVAKGAPALTVDGLKVVPILTYDEPRPLRLQYPDGKAIPEEKLVRQRAAIARKTEAMLMGKLGECVVRNAPVQSRAVLATSLETPPELQSINALGATLGQCIKAGETVSLDRMSVRGALAIAYYRLSQAQGSGASL
ncbi:hypothetical protein [Novosphingobium sp.]|uniref:hypothetical protein n=1 Tax=Novosphingobium sp. TaxID=1874826 RepID=UPI00286D767B|nr:hypothetical protein [Novosphingobium sp.]